MVIKITDRLQNGKRLYGTRLKNRNKYKKIHRAAMNSGGFTGGVMGVITPPRILKIKVISLTFQ